MEFSVLISIYKNEKGEYFKAALESIVNQTLKPNEIVIVKDGPIGIELDSIIEELSSVYDGKLNVVSLDKNVGLGLALNVGIEKCTYEIIARMDSDDICVKDRFEKQINEFILDKDLDVVGSNINEFYTSIDKVKAIKKVPEFQEEIFKYAKRRNPMNHMTVMFKKNSVVKAGNYMHMLYCEDYYLWARMLMAGCKFKNIQTPLVFARTGLDMYKRRGGKIYIKSEYNLQKSLNNIGLINIIQCYINIIMRSFPRLIPNKLREIIYLKLLRG